MKNINVFGPFYKVIFLLLIAFFLFGCDRNRRNPGWDYFPDMFYSTAYESFTKNPNFKDGMTMRVPVSGTVPRNFVPFNYTVDPESRVRAGIELVNPLPSSEETILQGKVVFSKFCSGCHGITGEGNGLLYEKGLYQLKPRSLINDISEKLKDGEIFHSITLGFGSMGAHGAQIGNEDSWKLVIYIRKLQEDAGELSVNENDKKKQ